MARYRILLDNLTYSIYLNSRHYNIYIIIKQLEVPCYPERVINDFTERIGRLKGEYKAFLTKLKALDQQYKVVPLAERVYEVRGNKRKSSNNTGMFLS